jgi:hypothetical protein
MAAVEAQFALVQLVGEFIILLISLTIAVYAIAASFLGKEYRKTLNKIKTKRENTEKDLAEKIISGEISKLKDIEKTIDCFKKSERQLSNRVRKISLRSVVVTPNIFFGTSLLITGLSMYYYPYYKELFILGEIILISSGLFFFSRALMGVQIVSQEIEGEGEE